MPAGVFSCHSWRVSTEPADLEEVMARDKYGFLGQKKHDARDAEKML